MNSRRVAVALALTLAAIISLPAADAEACSPLPEGWFASIDTQFPQQIPVDGALVVRAQAYGVNHDAPETHLRVEVTDAAGESVAGSLGAVVLEEGPDEPPGAADEVLVHWTPDSALEPEAQYTLTWQDSYKHSGWRDEQQVSFETTSEQRPDVLQPAMLEAPIADIDETRAGFECCTDNALCDTCGDCTRCWATRYAYRPMLRASASLPDTGSTPQVYYEVLAGGEVRDRFWTGEASKDIAVSFDEDADGPYCVTVNAFDILGGTGVTSNTECIERDELPDYTERSPDESAPEVCNADTGDSDDAGPGPDMGTSEDGGPDQAEDAGNDDAGVETPSAATTGDSGCGCAQTGGGVPGGLAGLIAWLGGLMLWRRR